MNKMKQPKKTSGSERPSQEWWAEAVRKTNESINGPESMWTDPETDLDTNQLQVTFVPMKKANS